MDFLLMEGDELEKIDFANIQFFYLQGLYLDNANYSSDKYCLEESEKQVQLLITFFLDQRIAEVESRAE